MLPPFHPSDRLRPVANVRLRASQTTGLLRSHLFTPTDTADYNTVTQTNTIDVAKAMLSMAISACRKLDRYCGICGQGPSDHPDLAQWLVEQGIESMSLNPDTVIETWLHLAGKKA